MTTMTVQSRLPSFRLANGPAWLFYGAAVVLPVLTLLLRLAFWDYVPGMPFTTFVPLVCLIAFVGGTGPASATAVVSAILGLAYLSAPSPFGPDSQVIWTGFACYALVCLTLLTFTQQLSRASAEKLKAAAEQAIVRESALQARLEAAEAAAARGQVERRLQVLTDALPVMIAQISRDFRYQFGNRTYQDWFGVSPEALRGQHLKDVLGDEVLQKLRPHIDTVLSGRPVTFEQRLSDANGRERHIRAHYMPNVGPDGGVEGYFALVEDVTEAKQQAELLARSERHIRAVLESVTDCFYAVDADWRITLVNRAAERYFGRSREDLLGRSLWEAFPELVGTRAEENLRRVMEDRVPATFEAMSALHQGHYKEIRVSPKGGSGIAVSFSNITERKQAERHRELLVNELNHRVKNTLSVVQAIATKTFSGSSDPRLSRRAFEGRLMALAAAHDLLTSESWEAANLEGLIRATLRPFAIEQRLDLAGPNLRVRPQAAVTLSLALHELATNAAKYGSLSSETGRITLRWTVTKGDPSTFRMVWKERDGPEVTPPIKSGFGSRLIEQGLAGELDGTVALSYAPEGLICTIHAPVANLEVV